MKINRFIYKFLFSFFLIFLIKVKVYSIELKLELINPVGAVITRHPEIIIKFPIDVSPIVDKNSIRVVINNIDFTNYIRYDFSSPVLYLIINATKPLNNGINNVVVKGKLINDDTFENYFKVVVDPKKNQQIKNIMLKLENAKDNKTKAYYYNELGKIYENLKYYPDALGYFNLAMTLDPNNKQAKDNFNRLFSAFNSKALKLLNVVVDVNMITIDSLVRNGYYLFKVVIENYRDQELSFNLDNFLVVDNDNNFYRPLANPFESIRKDTINKKITIEDFAISNYLLQKENLNFNYKDEYVLKPYESLKLDLVFYIPNKKFKNISFQVFKIKIKEGRKEDNLPVVFKLPFSI
ncbi:MAG: tetratricopeptide repeat protein [bacterium]|jgi:tetratricopeptide (TPR) repeat protein